MISKHAAPPAALTPPPLSEQSHDPGAARSPLWATVSLTFVDNIGAAATVMGAYFVATRAYAFTARESFALGLLQGITYVMAAMAAGPGTRRLAGPGRALSTRSLLIGLHIALCAVCLTPILWRSPWAIWLTIGLYSPLTGWLWPAIESFLSAGRSGADLRRSSGAFNMSWASCQVLTLWAIAPFIDKHPLWAIPVMGVSHLLAIPLAMMLRREPAAHGIAAHAHDAAERARYRRLLNAHRYLLILSYIVLSALNPMLPTLITSLGVSDLGSTPMASSWTLGRVFMFALMGAWGGWHGRAATLIWPAALLLLGFSASMLAPSPWVLSLGLVFFGFGMGAIYSSAFYYAMEVGSAGVDAGGKHEAMIGVGYAAGPLLGLLAGELAAQGMVESSRIPALTVALVLAAALVFVPAIVRSVRR